MRLCGWARQGKYFHKIIHPSHLRAESVLWHGFRYGKLYRTRPALYTPMRGDAASCNPPTRAGNGLSQPNRPRPRAFSSEVIVTRERNGNCRGQSSPSPPPPGPSSHPAPGAMKGRSQRIRTAREDSSAFLSFPCLRYRSFSLDTRLPRPSRKCLANSRRRECSIFFLAVEANVPYLGIAGSVPSFSVKPA